MSGILLIGVVSLWIWAAVAIGQMLTSKLKDSWIKSLVTFLVTAVLIPLPVADEIVGGFQFRALCDKYAVQEIDRKNAYNREVLSVGGNKGRFAEGTAVQIHIQPWIYQDKQSGLIIVSYNTLHAKGGWFIRALGISETNSPLLFNGDCAPPNQNDFKSKFNITVIN